MPSGLILHEGYALAFHRLHDNRGRHSLRLSSLSEGSSELVHVVAIVHIDHMEMESLEFLVNGVR